VLAEGDSHIAPQLVGELSQLFVGRQADFGELEVRPVFVLPVGLGPAVTLRELKWLFGVSLGLALGSSFVGTLHKEMIPQEKKTANESLKRG
jgi:hypothetical protein